MIPEKLKKIDQWCVWKRIQEDGKEKKVPVNPTNYMTYEDAKSKLAMSNGDFAGLAFQFKGTPYMYVDLDTYKDPAHASVHKQILDLAMKETFVEKSQSGEGWHIIYEGIKAFKTNKAKGIDIDENKLLYVTGDSVGQDEIISMSIDMHELLSKHLTETKTEPKIESSVSAPAEFILPHKPNRGDRTPEIIQSTFDGWCKKHPWRTEDRENVDDHSAEIYHYLAGARYVTDDHPALMLCLIEPFCTKPHELERAIRWDIPSIISEGGDTYWADMGDWVKDDPQPIPDIDYEDREPPLDTLPRIAKNAIMEASRFVGISPVVAAMDCIGAVAFCLCKTSWIEERYGHIYKCSMWLNSVLPSGERKTAIAKIMTRPLMNAQEQLQTVHNATQGDRDARIDELKTKISKAKSDLKKLDKEGELKGIWYTEKTALENTVLPRLLVSDITEEVLKTKLDQNDGCIMLIASEAGHVAKNILNQYGEDSKETTYLQALTQDTIMVDRRGREECIKDPALVLDTLTLPRDFNKLMMSEIGKGGMHARMLVAFPKEMIGTRFIKDQPGLNENMLIGYNLLIEKLLSTVILHKYMFRLSLNAYDLYETYHDHIEKQMAKGGKLRLYKDSVNKIVTFAVKLGCIMQALNDPEKLVTSAGKLVEKDIDIVVTTDNFRKGIQWATYFLNNMIYAQDQAEEDRAKIYAKELIRKWQKSKSAKVKDMIRRGAASGSLQSAVSVNYRDSINEVIDVWYRYNWINITFKTDDQGRHIGFIKFHPKFMHSDVDKGVSIVKGDVPTTLEGLV